MPLAGSLETGEFGSCPWANGNKTSVLPHHKRAPETTYKIVKMLLYPFKCPIERRRQKQFKILHCCYWGYEVSWRSVEMYIHFNIPPGKGLDSTVTCRAVGQRKHLAASSSEPQQAPKGNQVSHLLGHSMSLSLTLSNRLAFTFVVVFKPLFLKAGSRPLIWIPHWTPIAEMPCGKEYSRNGSIMEEDWLLLGICHMLDRFLNPLRAFWHVFAHAHYKQNACVENSVGAGTWSLLSL